MTSKRAVCVIPSGEMLRIQPVAHWLKKFSEFTRRTAGEVVLPAVGFRGPLYESEVHPWPVAYDSTNLLPNWVKAARESMGDKATVWASIIVNLQFLENEALWLRDQYDQDLSQICIVNPVAQQLLGVFINEIISSGIDGVVLDLTDAYPNSGSSGYAGIQATCFCDYCIEGLKLNGFSEPKEVFVGEKGLLRLVLRLDDDGAAHIDPTSEWIDGRNANSLVTLALARKFVTGERAALEAEAIRLLTYFRARVNLTAQAIRAVLNVCKKLSKRSAVVLGSADADLSQMVTLQALEAEKSADEYWLPGAPSPAKHPAKSQALQFLASRSTYNFNSFFEIVENAEDNFRFAGAESFLSRLLQTSKRLAANKLNPGAAYTVDHLDQFVGFAGVPLGEDDHLEIIERLTQEITGDVLPSNLLDKFRILNPDKRPQKQ